MFPGQTGNADAIWHPATDGPALAALLADLGLTGGSRGAEVGYLVAADPAPLRSVSERSARLQLPAG